MPLASGARIGPYEVQSLIGTGGMGQVYRAHDTKLERDVALKLLPDDFVSDSDRMARFQREAQVLASLNHPNIAQIYGLEDSTSTRCIVMELVEGESLDEQLKRGPLPVEEAVRLAREIADALEAAHERGIVHRDLKPANIKITPEGKVKVLDFGLAKALAGARDVNVSNSPTLSMAATQQGVILGTAAYMSPEQARGRSVDKRGDIWSFGCVLYEMLTGKQAFEGSDVSELLAAVIKSEPEWQKLSSAVPPALRVFLRRCLEKDPKRRIHDIADVRLALEGAFDLPAASYVEPHTLWRPGWRRTITVGAVCSLLAALPHWTCFLVCQAPCCKTARAADCTIELHCRVSDVCCVW
jgi:serine/threonine protein kinase